MLASVEFPFQRCVDAVSAADVADYAADFWVPGIAGIGIRAARGFNTSQERETERYLNDMAALNVRRPDVYARATEEIPAMIEIIQVLLERGYATARWPSRRRRERVSREVTR